MAQTGAMLLRLDRMIQETQQRQQEMEERETTYWQKRDEEQKAYQQKHDEEEKAYRRERDERDEAYRRERNAEQAAYWQKRDEEQKAYQQKHDEEEKAYRRERDERDEAYRRERNAEQAAYWQKRDEEQKAYQQKHDEEEKAYRRERDERDEASRLEREARDAENRQEMQQWMQEAEKRAQDHRREWSKKWGEIANSIGRIVEDIAAPNIHGAALTYFGFDEILDFMVRRKVKNRVDRSKQHEFDVVVVGQDRFIINETKSIPQIEFVNGFIATRSTIYDYFPDYRGKKVIPIFTSLHMDESMVSYLTRNNVYAMVIKDDTMDILNFEQVNDWYDTNPGTTN